MRSPIAAAEDGRPSPSACRTIGGGWPALAQRSRRPAVRRRRRSSRATAAVASVSVCMCAIASSRPRSTSAGPGAAVVGDAAQQPAQLAHRRRGRRVVPDDVADHDDRGAVALQEGVVPVAAHPGGLGGRHVPDDDRASADRRRIGEQAALQRLGELGLLALPVHPGDRPGRPRRRPAGRSPGPPRS